MTTPSPKRKKRVVLGVGYLANSKFSLGLYDSKTEEKMSLTRLQGQDIAGRKIRLIAEVLE